MKNSRQEFQNVLRLQRIWAGLQGPDHEDFFLCDLISDSSCPFLVAKVLRCLEVLWLLCSYWTGKDVVLPFEVPSVFGWIIFSTDAALNSGNPALET